MAAMTKDEMLGFIQAWLTKIEAGGIGDRSEYMTADVAAKGSTVIDAPTLFGFTAATHHIYSMGVDLKMVDAGNPTPVSVVPATAVLDYVIDTAGKVTIRNWSTVKVTYHVRISAPIKK